MMRTRYHSMDLARPSHGAIRKGVSISFSLAGVLFASVWMTAVSSAAQESKPALPYREDRVLIKPKASVDRVALASFHGTQKVRVRRQFSAFEDIQVLELLPGASVPDMVRRYQASGLVEHAQPDYWVHPAAAPNDPRFLDGKLWYLHNTGVHGLPDADIDAAEAWDVRSTASNIIVAVVDTGVWLTHQDLAANLWVNPDETPGDGLDNDGNGIIDDVNGLNAAANSGNVIDPVGHGTRVAGVIGAVGNNGVGVAGVAWRVQLMTCRYVNDAGAGSTSDIIQCIDYARAKGAHVINGSFVFTPYDLLVFNAINACRTAGILFVAAAGNNASNNDLIPQYPASYNLDNVVAVAGTTPSDGFWGSSAYGVTNVDLGAPAEGIYCAASGANTNYAWDTGTSYSAAVVSGALALLKAGLPDFTHRQLIDLMLGTVDPLPALAGKCATGGRVNLGRAMALAAMNYQITNGAYSWIDPSGMTELTLSNDGVSPAQALPFAFRFYGQDYTELYVGANGLIGFGNAGLNLAANTDLPNTNSPNAILCPLWDDLRPDQAGTVHIGTTGTAPDRKVVVSWVGVRRAGIPVAYFTFQAWLEEGTGRIQFQYQDVAPSSANAGAAGKSATVGLEHANGLMAGTFSYNGSTLLSNGQAILFLPGATPMMDVVPTSGLAASGMVGGSFAPNSKVYTVTNIGILPLDWTVSKSQTWLSLSASGGTLAAGKSTNITVSINTNANALPAGLHEDNVGFTNATSGHGNTSRVVALTVNAPPGQLGVTPAGGLTSSGTVGGPFTPDSQTYTLTNSGGSALDWTATKIAAWLTLSASSGILAAGASTNVVVSINANADALASGAYTDTVGFTNATTGQGKASRGVLLTVNATPGELEVTPVGPLSSAGHIGGPFAPSNQDYTLTNTGGTALDWLASTPVSWLTLAPSNGTLTPGASATVLASLNSNAPSLPAGSNFAQITFSNMTSGASRLRGFTLQVHPLPSWNSGSLHYSDSFHASMTALPGWRYFIEASTNFTDWSRLATNQADGAGFLTFSDAEAPSFSQRFYRAVAAP